MVQGEKKKMKAREEILTALGKKETIPGEPPRYIVKNHEPADLPEAFSRALKEAGGEAVFRKGDMDVASIVSEWEEAGIILDARNSGIREFSETIFPDLLIVEAEFGVAENGSVWIDPGERYPRALLTLAENLAVVLPVENILPTMHEAYERIDLAKTSYALFMAGPSKTADIEQSLVIGAHGAMGMKVFLI